MINTSLKYANKHKVIQLVENFEINWNQRIIGEKYNPKGKASKVS